MPHSPFGVPRVNPVREKLDKVTFGLRCVEKQSEKSPRIHIELLKQTQSLTDVVKDVAAQLETLQFEMLRAKSSPQVSPALASVSPPRSEHRM